MILITRICNFILKKETNENNESTDKTGYYAKLDSYVWLKADTIHANHR